MEMLLEMFPERGKIVFALKICACLRSLDTTALADDILKTSWVVLGKMHWFLQTRVFI